MKYCHLTQDERSQIYAYKSTGMSQTQMAFNLGRSKSTISREFSRNTGDRGYRPKQAHQMAVDRFKNAEKAISITSNVIAIVEEKIREDWSPEQISGRLATKKGIFISHESIYQHILLNKKEGGDLYTHLRCKKKNRKRYGTKSHDKRGKIKDKVSIEKRPQVVEEKSRKGDWEGDLVIGKNHKCALVTIADRKTKKVKIGFVESKNANVVQKMISKLLKRETVFTVTLDNGKEFSCHKEMAKNTGAKIYFAHPYSSWERGLNENTNGLIRQYFPKGSSFKDITKNEVQRVEDILNNRPRKTLGYCTPNEVYSGERRVQYE